jgi:hypothetical protein
LQEAQAILRRGRNFIVEIIPNRLPYYNCVDSFGRYRRETEAARAQLLGSVDAQQTVIMTLVSDAASDYFLLRDLEMQLQITQQTVRDQQELSSLPSCVCSTVWARRSTYFRLGTYLTPPMHKSQIWSNRAATRRTRSTSSWTVIGCVRPLRGGFDEWKRLGYPLEPVPPAIPFEPSTHSAHPNNETAMTQQ